MNKKEISNLAVNALKKEYKEAKCSLNYENEIQLLIAVRLSAQCTDARVNIVTEKLFKKYKTVEDFANASVSDLERYIKPCGFYRIKSRDIINMSKKIIRYFGGKLPDNIEDLVSLPGVGRKTANLIMGDIFKKAAIVVDTHCMRITRRLSLHDEKDPYKVEIILKKIIEPSESNDFCHRLVLHGRAVCTARNPKCDICVMNKFCPKNI